MTHTCPQCLAEFPTHHKMIGHIGGKHGSVAWGRKAPGYIEHGTNKGYLAHRRHGITACKPCKTARATYVRTWRAMRRVWKS